MLNHNENREYCKRVALELEAYAELKMFACPICGETCTLEEIDGEYHLSCGCVTDIDPDQLSLYDWFADVLDYEFTIDSTKDFRHGKIWVTLGGPNVWVDTETATVELRWGNESASFPIDYNARDELDEILREIYEA